MKRISNLVLALAVLVCGIAPAGAAQVVRFKTGFEMLATSVRYDGEMIILTLEGGSQVGFPKWVIEEVSLDQSTPGFTTDRFDRNKVRDLQTLGGGKFRSFQVPGNGKGAEGAEAFVLASGVSVPNDGKSVPIGFSTGGPQERFLPAAPTGPVNANGDVGVSMLQLRNERKGTGGIDPATGKPVGGVRVLKPKGGAGSGDE